MARLNQMERRALQNVRRDLRSISQMVLPGPIYDRAGKALEQLEFVLTMDELAQQKERKRHLQRTRNHNKLELEDARFGMVEYEAVYLGPRHYEVVVTRVSDGKRLLAVEYVGVTSSVLAIDWAAEALLELPEAVVLEEE